MERKGATDTSADVRYAAVQTEQRLQRPGSTRVNFWPTHSTPGYLAVIGSGMTSVLAFYKHPTAQLLDARDTAVRHCDFQLRCEDAQRMAHARLSAGGQPVERGPPQLHGVRPQRERLGDICAMPKAAVDQRRQPACSGCGHAGQLLDGGSCAIKLPAKTPRICKRCLSRPKALRVNATSGQTE